jgi:citrate lyase subunit beta/citryl-CoA lyase
MAKKAGREPARRGEAGRRGDDVRSDAHVSVEIHDSGGLNLAVASKVASFYGRSIRETATAVLARFGVEHGQIEIDDKGALPFVLAARIETALRRAGVARTAPPDRTMDIPGPTERDRLRRSRLYLPGNEPKFLVNAGLHEPDAVILDLEDSVHPSEKDAARIVVRNALRCVDFHGAERMVRINQPPLGLIDLEEVVPESPHLILIPKVENADQVREVAQRVENIQAGESRGPVWLMPILESALGIEHAFEIARATDSIVAVTIGLEDYTADLGVRKTTEGSESLYARTRLVNAAHAAGVQAIDSVFGDVGDMEGLKTWGSQSRSLGFEGMGCIHPRQIQPIHEAFAPSTEEIEKAQRIVIAFQEAEAKGLGVVSLGSRMIDRPVVLRAQRLVERARRAGLIPEPEDAVNGGNR